MTPFCLTAPVLLPRSMYESNAAIKRPYPCRQSIVEQATLSSFTISLSLSLVLYSSVHLPRLMRRLPQLFINQSLLQHPQETAPKPGILARAVETEQRKSIHCTSESFSYGRALGIWMPVSFLRVSESVNRVPLGDVCSVCGQLDSIRSATTLSSSE